MFQTQTFAAVPISPARPDEREKATDATASQAAAAAASAAATAAPQPHRFRNALGSVTGGRRLSVVAGRVPQRPDRRRRRRRRQRVAAATPAPVVDARALPSRSQLSLRLAAAGRDARQRRDDGPGEPRAAVALITDGRRRGRGGRRPVARQRRSRVARRPARRRGDRPYVAVAVVPAQPLLRPEPGGRVPAAPPTPPLRPSRRQVAGVRGSRDRAAGQRAERRVPRRPRPQRPSPREQHESKGTALFGRHTQPIVFIFFF